MSATPDSTLADPKDHLITDLQRQLAKRTIERDAALQREAVLTAQLAQRDDAYEEPTAYQAATIDVLHAISISPDDPRPVFELIVRWARDLCGSWETSVIEYDGALLHMRAISAPDAEAAARLMAAFLRPPTMESVPGRVALSGEIVCIADASLDPVLMQATRGFGPRSMLGMPLLSEGRVIGVVMLSWPEPNSFNDSAVAVVQSFAEQAVIAIAPAIDSRQDGFPVRTPIVRPICKLGAMAIRLPILAAIAFYCARR